MLSCANALDGLCSRSWQGDLEEIPTRGATPTPDQKYLPQPMFGKCLVTLLRDGFGSCTRVDITHLLQDGSEVNGLWKYVLRAE
jgi:hypothetical protein